MEAPRRNENFVAVRAKPVGSFVVGATRSGSHQRSHSGITKIDDNCAVPLLLVRHKAVRSPETVSMVEVTRCTALE